MIQSKSYGGLNKRAAKLFNKTITTILLLLGNTFFYRDFI